MYPYEIIDEIVPFCPGWHRNAGGKSLLRLVERAVNGYYSDVSWRFKDNSNEGKVPHLLTTDNVFEYPIIAANLSCGEIEKTIDGVAYLLEPKKVQRVYMDVTRRVTDYRLGLGKYGEEFEESGRWYIKIPVDSEVGSAGTPPIVRFTENPGTSTDKYLIDLQVGCPNLSAETIPIPIPKEFEEGAVDYCIGTCQKRENGRIGELLLGFEEIWKPRFRRYLAGAASLRTNKTNVRLC
jgi:hypothetical protein